MRPFLTQFEEHIYLFLKRVIFIATRRKKSIKLALRSCHVMAEFLLFIPNVITELSYD